MHTVTLTLLTGDIPSCVLKTDDHSRIFGDKVGDVTMPRTYSYILNRENALLDVVSSHLALKLYHRLYNLR